MRAHSLHAPDGVLPKSKVSWPLGQYCFFRTFFEYRFLRPVSHFKHLPLAEVPCMEASWPLEQNPFAKHALQCPFAIRPETQVS